MTISTETSRIPHSGDGSTTAFAAPFKFFADADLTVVLVVDSTGVETTQTLTTNYSVTGAGADAGGTVTMVTAPAVGETLVIFRDPSKTQELDLTSGGNLSEASLEAELDREVMISQRFKNQLERAVRFTEGYTGSASPFLPAPVASKLLGINAAGDGLALYAIDTVSGSITVTSFMETMLGLSSAVTARGHIAAGPQSGDHTIWVPAGAMTPATTNGCAALVTTEIVAGNAELISRAFADSAEQAAIFSVATPKGMNSIDHFRVYWTIGGASTEAVAWQMQHASVSDSALIGQAFSAAVVQIDANQGTALDLLISPEASFGSIPASYPCMNYFRVSRDPLNVGDTRSGNANLIGVEIVYQAEITDD